MPALLFLLHAAVTMVKMAGDAIVSALWRQMFMAQWCRECCLIQ